MPRKMPPWLVREQTARRESAKRKAAAQGEQIVAMLRAKRAESLRRSDKDVPPPRP